MEIQSYLQKYRKSWRQLWSLSPGMNGLKQTAAREPHTVSMSTRKPLKLKLLLPRGYEDHPWFLTHSCLEIYLMNVVWNSHTFENNLRRKHKFEN